MLKQSATREQSHRVPRFLNKIGIGQCVAVLLLLAATTAGASAQLMAPAGKFEVSPGGAAVYTFPIAVPPGTAGVQPTLTLEYSSQNSNGIVGMGWSLGGLPTVTRCPRTVIQNGVAGGVNFDANDRFCLDGQQITAISGAYGADGTEYRTEIETFNRIVSHGTAGSRPAWFEVRTKSGQILQFGNTADSRPLTASGTARSWVLNKISDTKGNYLTVTYHNDSANGQIYPLSIVYTGNAAAGLAPYNTVQFEYVERPDASLGYHAGSITRTTVRLTNVKTYSGNTLVGDYRLGYEQGPGSLRSRLTFIAQCAGDGSCLPASTFTWTNGGVGEFAAGGQALSQSLGSPPPAAEWVPISGDFNGDGKSDVSFIRSISSTYTMHYTLLSNGDGSFTTVQQDINGYDLGIKSNTCILITGDFNADGKTDFGCLIGTKWQAFLSNGNGTFSGVGQLVGGSFNDDGEYEPGGGYQSANFVVVAGDFNVDGRTDFLLVRANNLYLFMGVGNGTFTQSSSTLSTEYGQNPPATWTSIGGDFNGDGKTDFVLASGNVLHTYLGNGDGTFTRIDQTLGGSLGVPPTASWTPIAGDFNGDGKTDFAFVAGSSITTFLSTGNGLFANPSQGISPANFGYPPSAGYTPITGDFNGDGRSDFAFVSSGTSTSNYPLLSKGDGTFTLGSQAFGVSLGSPPHASWLPVPGDFKGDGSSDFVFITAAQTTVFLSVSGVSDLMASITSGLGLTTSITYKPLTQGSVYTKDANATYPVADVIGPIQVVSRVDTANGIGGTYSTTYSYAGAKSDVRGRFLGFRQVKVQDLQTNILQITNYRQDFPFIGMPDSVTKSLGAQTLNQGTTTFQFSNAGGAASVSTPTITSAPYRVSVAQTVAASKDLDGSVMPTVTTTNQFDAFGNATQIVVSTPDGFSKTTTNTYSNDTTNWFLGRLTGASVLSTTPY